MYDEACFFFPCNIIMEEEKGFGKQQILPLANLVF